MKKIVVIQCPDGRWSRLEVQDGICEEADVGKHQENLPNCGSCLTVKARTPAIVFFK